MDDDWRKRLESRRNDLISVADALETGRVTSHDMRDGKQVDTTAEWAARFREYVAELEDLLAR
jgi:hypothetical protein